MQIGTFPHVQNMSYLFYKSNCNGDGLETWNVSNVTKMEGMFGHTENFNSPSISNWNVSNVTNMCGMFVDSIFNQNIGNWNTSKVTDVN